MRRNPNYKKDDGIPHKIIPEYGKRKFKVSFICDGYMNCLTIDNDELLMIFNCFLVDDQIH